LDTGGFVKPAKLTVGDFLRRWLCDYAATNVRPRTLEGYRAVVEGHLVPALGSFPLSRLQASHLQAYYGDKLSNGRHDGLPGGLSARSVLHHHRILSEALSHAVRWGLIGRNVALAVDPPRAVNHEIRPLDADAVRTFLEAADSSMYYPLFHLDIYTGLRRSEILGLRWRDVDLDMATVSVVQVLHRLKDGRFVFQEPKTVKSRRQVSLSPAAVLALRAYRQRREAECALLGEPLSEERLVFCHPDGTPMRPDNVSRAFARISHKAGLQGARFHDLRHTHATLMLKQGVHPKIVQERLGHATIAVTLDTYSHVLPGLQEQAALRFEEELARERDTASVAGIPKGVH
jgi:integrase